jgi:hypothetical protein
LPGRGTFLIAFDALMVLADILAAAVADHKFTGDPPEPPPDGRVDRDEPARRSDHDPRGPAAAAAESGAGAGVGWRPQRDGGDRLERRSAD